MCEICSSDLLGDINKKINWRPDRVVKWAKKRGLDITAKQLDRHFHNHLTMNSKTTNKIKEAKDTRKQSRQSRFENQTALPEAAISDDSGFLDEVVKRVYVKLTDDKFDLKLEHGFKAIEIKQKISDKSDVENMLLELLNEIRAQELDPAKN